jgi:hypothetical protein
LCVVYPRFSCRLARKALALEKTKQAGMRKPVVIVLAFSIVALRVDKFFSSKSGTTKRDRSFRTFLMTPFPGVASVHYF